LSGFLIGPLPEWLVPKRLDTTVQSREILVNEVRRTWATIAGGAIAVGVLLTALWRSHIANRAVLESEQGQITERFTRAIDQLGRLNEGDHTPHRVIRLGAVYALEQIALDAPDKYHWQIMEVLSAYVRESHRYWASQRDLFHQTETRLPLQMDVQAALTVIGRRNWPYDMGRRIDLERADLREYDLFGVRLRGAYLFGAHLEHSNLAEARLQGAILTHANLEGANLMAAQLQNSNLIGARLTGAILIGARLDGASLTNAHLDGVDLSEVSLTGASRPENDIPGWQADSESRLYRIADCGQSKT
jgi:hypothetical protein